jgi:predicted extracellular nuclease
MKRQLVLGILVTSLAIAAGVLISSCGATDNGGGGDADTDTDTDSDTDTDPTINEVRQNDGVSPDSAVTIAEVVVTSPTYVKDTGNGVVYVEEPGGGPWSGIELYLYSEVLLTTTLNRGDVVTVTGTYTEFYGVSEITVVAAADLVVTGTADVPAPAVVAPADVIVGGAAAESYESVLVRVEDVACSNPDLGYGEFEVTGGLPVDDWFFASGGGPSGYNAAPIEGDTFDAINGILGFTNFNAVDEFKMQPRDLDDYEGYTGAVETAPQEVTINQIQGGEVTDGSGVIITDVVVTSPLTFDGTGFFVEEPEGGEYSGIYVYNYNGDTDPAAITVGDVVTITGTYSEFNGGSEVTIDASTAVAVTSSGAALPAPVEIADPAAIATDGADAARYEGVLVHVTDVTVTVATDTYGEFTVTGSLLVGSIFFETALSPAVDTVYTSITAPLNYSFYDSKLEPRTAADLVE